MNVDNNYLFNQDDFEDIQYFLTSTFRIKILLELYESNKTTKNLKKTLNKSESNILHYLKDFEEKEIVKRYKEEYTLTSKGYLITRHLLKLTSNWKTINSNIDFWDNNHLYDNLHLSFVLNMNLWNNSKLITNDNLDYNKPSHIYSKLIRNCKHIKVVLPILSTYHLDIILTTLEENSGTLYLITSNKLLERLYTSKLYKRFSKLKNNGNIKLKITNTNGKLNKFLTCTENFASLYLIYTNGMCDDSVMLLNKDRQSVKKLNTLFDEYKSEI